MNINLTLIAQAISFSVLIWFAVHFIWPPLLRVVEARQKTIADGLAAADRGKHELELAGKKSAQQVHAAKEKATEIVSLAEKRAVEIIEKAKEDAKAEGARIIAGAKAEIDRSEPCQGRPAPASIVAGRGGCGEDPAS